jgi:type II secretory pathway component PulK
VLLLVGVVSLVFLVAVSALDTLRDQTREERTEVAFRQALLTAEARLTFLAATRPMISIGLQGRPDRDGLPTLLLGLDGRPYRMARPDLTVALQDEAGMVNLANLDPPVVDRLLGALGVKPADRAMMRDRIADFVDIDALARASGAEGEAYRQAGLAPPPNASLIRPQQLYGVLGWRQAVDERAWSSLAGTFTADPESADINVNTASPMALQLIFGFDATQAANAVRTRAIRPFATLEDFGRNAGVAVRGDIERNYTFPNGRIAITVTDRVSGRVGRSRLVLTLNDPDQPFWLEAQTLSIAPATGRAVEIDAPEFPSPTS